METERWEPIENWKDIKVGDELQVRTRMDKGGSKWEDIGVVKIFRNYTIKTTKGCYYTTFRTFRRRPVKPSPPPPPPKMPTVTGPGCYLIGRDEHKEFNSRVSELEGQIAELDALLDLKNARIAKLKANQEKWVEREWTEIRKGDMIMHRSEGRACRVWRFEG
jgi:hypothetical protein